MKQFAARIFDNDNFNTFGKCQGEHYHLEGNYHGEQAEVIEYLCEYALYKVKIVESPTPDGDNTVIAQSITKDKVSGRDTEVTLTVNTKLQGMPNFYLESLVDTMAYLDAAGIPYTYVIYEGVVDEDVIVGFRDLMDLLVRLESCGAYPSTRIDENTLVVFQSIPMGGEIPTEGALQLVCLNYEAF